MMKLTERLLIELRDDLDAYADARGFEVSVYGDDGRFFSGTIEAFSPRHACQVLSESEVWFESYLFGGRTERYG